MSERRFVQSMSTKKHIQTELDDLDIIDPVDWREAVDMNTPLESHDKLQKRVNQNKRQKTELEVSHAEIDDTSWQRQLDMAFEQDDYELIKTMRRVRPDSLPSSAVLITRLSELVVSRPDQWTEKFKKIRNLAKLEPDPNVLKREFEKLLEHFDTKTLKEFLETTSYKPDTEVIQAKFRDILYSGRLDVENEMSDLKSLTGIKPDISLFNEIMIRGDRNLTKIASIFEIEITEGMISNAAESANERIQKSYEELFIKQGYLDVSRILRIGVQPSPELVQRAYQKIIEHWNSYSTDKILELKKATGIEPVFTEEQVRSYFESFWHERGPFNEILNINEKLGLKPDAKLVLVWVCRLIDRYCFIRFHNGKDTRDTIEWLIKNTIGAIKIPDIEIQTRYQKAIVEKNFYAIINLYDALDISPSIDKETVRQFMLDCLGRMSTNEISALEKIFGIKFELTAEEFKTKQDEMLAQSKFYSLMILNEFSNAEVDKQKLQTAMLHFLTEKINVPEKIGMWKADIQKYLSFFDITLSTEMVFTIYDNVISNEQIYRDNLEAIYQITGIKIPETLAYKAYEKVLAPDYVTSGKIEYHDRKYDIEYKIGETFDTIYQISGIRPQISFEKVQLFYQRKLKESDFIAIDKISEITGIQPVFDSDEINQLYKENILVQDPHVYYIKRLKDYCGIEIKLDEETINYILNYFEIQIQKICSDYFRKEITDVYFRRDHLKRYLGKISELVSLTGLEINFERLQTAYLDILNNDPFFSQTIKVMIEILGIQPLFDQKQLQVRGNQFLENGDLNGFTQLQSFGNIELIKESSQAGFNVLVSTIRKYDQRDNNYYYEYGWVENLKKFIDVTGIVPTESQLAEIFSNISRDTRLAQAHQIDDRIDKIIKLFSENFQTEITPIIARDIVLLYIVRGSISYMKSFVQKTGIIPELTEMELLPYTNNWLKEKELVALSHLKESLKLNYIPVTENIAQETYQYFALQEDFGQEKGESLSSFVHVFYLTGIRPNLPREIIDKIYEKAPFKEWERIKKVIGELPGDQEIQNKYLKLLINLRWGVFEDIKAIQTFSDQSIATETITKALEFYALKGNFELMMKIIDIVGGKPIISHEVGQIACMKFIETSISKYGLEYGFAKKMDFLFDTLGVKPEGEALYQLFLKTLGWRYDGDYFKRLDADANGKKYQWWDVIIQRFGQPDSEIVQRIYLSQLSV